MISEETYLKMKELISEYENKKEISDEEEKPYIKVVYIETDFKYNPKYDKNKICECGHPYHRHFDSYENMEAIGCKYCSCFVFKEKK
jgi:hypothetical protein